jgi:hypothetical protein
MMVEGEDGHHHMRSGGNMTTGRKKMEGTSPVI